MKRRQARKIARCPDLNHRRSAMDRARHVLMVGICGAMRETTASLNILIRCTAKAREAFKGLNEALALLEDHQPVCHSVAVVPS